MMIRSSWFSGWALAVLFLVVSGCAATVTPLLTEGDRPAYLDAVVEILDGAEAEVLVMISDLRYYGSGVPASAPAEALAHASARGVDVRVHVNLWREPWDTQEDARLLLEEAGAAFRWWRDPDASLHAKTLIVDRRWVFAGSTHWTWNAMLDSVQCDLLVDSPEVAVQFVKLFDLLWEQEEEVVATHPEPPWSEPLLFPLLQPPGTEVHLEVLRPIIARAEHSVELLVYRMARYPGMWDSPSNMLIDALTEAAGRGVHVRVVLEGGEAFMDATTVRATREAAAYLVLSGVEVRLAPPGETMHAKCLLVDGRDTVVTSANWSHYSLARHAEAGLVVLGVPELARQLQELFNRVWRRSQPEIPLAAMHDRLPPGTLLQPV